MVTVAMVETQAEALRDVLSADVGETRIEARRTRGSAAKHDLQARTALVRGVLDDLGPVVSLDDSQAAVVADAVAAALGDLRVEIRHTDTPSYKRMLKGRAADLRVVLDAIRPPAERILGPA